ncbi:DNA binding protein [Fragilaria crotonensis]|nr:DNA binding protein [Fragilaria crotonensis]
MTFLLVASTCNLYQAEMPPKKEKAAPKKKSTGGKKKVSGYMLFCKETRPIIIKESPDLAFGAVGKELGKRWKALSDEEKEAYKK